LIDINGIPWKEDPPETVARGALHDALENGQTVVTATRRLARHLRTARLPEGGTPSWRTPATLPWSAWLSASCRELRDFGLLPEPRPWLDDFQAAAVWTEVLQADPLADGLLMPGGAVEGFRDAWQLAHDWQLPWAELGARGGEDCRAFLRLARTYRLRLEDLGCLDSADLPRILAENAPALRGPPIIFAGFDTLTPVQRSVFRALGGRARRARGPAPGGGASVSAFTDCRQEFAAAADWARVRLEANPAARLGIVVPDLEASAPLVEDLLDEALSPARLLPGGINGPRPWNVSLGRPLTDAPAVAAALLVAGLSRDALEFAETSRLLRSPFLVGAEEEGGRRARLDAWLRERGGDRVTRTRLLDGLAGRDGAPACPRLEAGVRGMLEELLTGPRRRPPSAWAASFTRGLRRLGWPGDSGVDSATWQAAQAWAGLLESLARLDTVLGALSVGDALSRLRRMASQQRFQPETPDLPVQVLGLLETAGLEFDGLWVTGMHDGVLPAPLRPCALLPAALQRERAMPRACPDTELALARRIVARLSGAAGEVRFSYPQNREDEPLRPSPVLAALPLAEATYVLRPGLAAASFEQRDIEEAEDRAGPGIAGEVSGGTGLLAAQSACPFRAFALHRLEARALETPAAGVDGRARGSLLHRALRDFWGEVGDRDTLAALDSQARAGRVGAALARAAAGALAGVPPGLVEVELQEAARRIGELLDIELQRPAFRVEQREHPVGIEVGPLRLRGQVDRMDRVPGGLAIIDYKTGEARVADWLGERPAEPQMPLYALAFAQDVVALAYASLKPGAVGFQGLACSRDALGDGLRMRNEPPADEWPARLDEWRGVLGALAAGFAAGDARVAPVRTAGAGSPCPRCHLAVLCRRDELLRAGSLGDD
jgi:ATP-dependent helicase/nuclease subunit B